MIKQTEQEIQRNFINPEPVQATGWTTQESWFSSRQDQVYALVLMPSQPGRVFAFKGMLAWKNVCLDLN